MNNVEGQDIKMEDKNENDERDIKMTMIGRMMIH